jgi:predicted NBD/HSP70 family sugar kinase
VSEYLRAGLDIGGSKIFAAAVDPRGRVVETLRLPSRTGPDGVVAAATEAVEALADRVGGRRALTGVGVGFPGLVDAENGDAMHAVNLDITSRLPLAARLRERLGLPVAVENDVNAAALGTAAALGLGRAGVGYLSIGTGLGAGLVIDGRLHRGSRAAAGEIGHIPVDPAGPVCNCGQRGCLEVLASGTAIAARWPHAEGGGPAAHLFAAAAAGDPAAIAVRDEVAGHIAEAVRVLVLTVDVDAVVLGGGVADVGAPLAEAVRDALRRQAEVSPFLRDLDLAGRVRITPPGLPVAAIGAALLVPAWTGAVDGTVDGSLEGPSAGELGRVAP